jgi:hypothetical protein
MDPYAFRDTGDLRDKYLAGGAGTYTRQANGTTWTKQGTTATQTPAQQYNPESDFKFGVQGNAITINGYTGTATDVKIPPTIQGLPVTTIRDAAFVSNTTLRSITIPASVTYIGTQAFNNCNNLITVTFLGTMTSASDVNPMLAFPGDLRDKYLAGGAGTYTRQAGISPTWTKK